MKKSIVKNKESISFNGWKCNLYYCAYYSMFSMQEYACVTLEEFDTVWHINPVLLVGNTC